MQINVSRHVRPTMLSRWAKRIWVWRLCRQQYGVDLARRYMKRESEETRLRNACDGDRRNRAVSDAITVESARMLEERGEI